MRSMKAADLSLRRRRTGEDRTIRICPLAPGFFIYMIRNVLPAHKRNFAPMAVTYGESLSMAGGPEDRTDPTCGNKPPIRRKADRPVKFLEKSASKIVAVEMVKKS